jgi:hypothetical protein
MSLKLMQTSQVSKEANQAKIKEMLATPTNNYGLAQLFKNFILIDTES